MASTRESGTSLPYFSSTFVTREGLAHAEHDLISGNRTPYRERRPPRHPIRRQCRLKPVFHSDRIVYVTDHQYRMCYSLYVLHTATPVSQVKELMQHAGRIALILQRQHRRPAFKRIDRAVRYNRSRIVQ